VARPQKRSRSRAARIALAIAIWFAVCVTVGVSAVVVYPGLMMLPTVTTYSPYCSTWQSVRDGNLKLQRIELAEDILARSSAVRTEGAYKLWSTPKGDYWVPNTSDNILSILLAQQEMRVYGDATTGGVKAGDIVLDGGAHVGTYARTALDAGADTVVAIEPSPEALWSLRRNLAKEIAASDVIVYDKGIWDAEATLTLFANGNGAAGDSFVTEGRVARKIADIPVTTIDRIVADLRLRRVDLIKADIKGAGNRMIRGAAQTIKAYHPRIVISTEEAPEDPVAIHDAVMAVDPSYQFRPGPCLFTSPYEVRNDTVFFE
jgi:FkbM family methyltransferase